MISQHIRDPVSEPYHKVISQTRYHKHCDMAYFVIRYQEEPSVIRDENPEMPYHEISHISDNIINFISQPYHRHYITYITTYQSISARCITEHIIM